MNDDQVKVERLDEKTTQLEKRVDDLGRRDGAAPASDATQGRDGTPAKSGGKRRIALLVVAGLLIVGLLFGVPAYLHSRNFVTTDDAFIEGHVVQIDPKVSAYVAAIHFDDNTQVNKGDLLLELDPRDLDVALQRARTQLAQAKAQVLQAQAGVEQSHAKLIQAQAQVIQQGAQVTQAGAQSQLAGVNFDRDTSLYTRDVKAIAKTNLDTTKSNYDAAQAMVDAAKANLDAAKANVEAEKSGTEAMEAQLAVAQATVGTAEAGVRDAELQLSYGKIYAPVSGRVTRKAVEPGDYVTVGQALLSLVPREVWVTANFKETQLTYMQAGQPVEVEIDAFPGKSWHGKVESLQKGTGSRFSLLPPENATGNYVKVIQRVPVKIVFDDAPERLTFLSPGLSAEPRVDVSSGRR